MRIEKNLSITEKKMYKIKISSSIGYYIPSQSGEFNQISSKYYQEQKSNPIYPPHSFYNVEGTKYGYH